ncbi:hypothetical protein FI667_g17706, partial [Globisporangium splendens]
MQKNGKGKRIHLALLSDLQQYSAIICSCREMCPYNTVSHRISSLFPLRVTATCNNSICSRSLLKRMSPPTTPRELLPVWLLHHDSHAGADEQQQSSSASCPCANCPCSGDNNSSTSPTEMLTPPAHIALIPWDDGFTPSGCNNKPGKIVRDQVRSTPCAFRVVDHAVEHETAQSLYKSAVRSRVWGVYVPTRELRFTDDAGLLAPMEQQDADEEQYRKSIAKRAVQELLVDKAASVPRGDWGVTHGFAVWVSRSDCSDETDTHLYYAECALPATTHDRRRAGNQLHEPEGSTARRVRALPTRLNINDRTSQAQHQLPVKRVGVGSTCSQHEIGAFRAVDSPSPASAFTNTQAVASAVKKTHVRHDNSTKWSLAHLRANPKQAAFGISAKNSRKEPWSIGESPARRSSGEEPQHCRRKGWPSA